MYNKAIDTVGTQLHGSFFGWGSGGSSNIIKIASMLKELGYHKVVAIFDGDKPEDLQQFRREYPNYSGFSISAPDIRDKPPVNKPAKCGMMTRGGELKEEYCQEMMELFTGINSYLETE